MSGNAPPPPAAQNRGAPPSPPGRPEKVSALLYDGIASYGGDISPNWNFANRGSNRFFLLNFVSIIGRLNLSLTQSGRYFEEATRIIGKETGWCDQVPELRGLKVSHTQITSKRDAPKLFSHAIVSVVAMEVAAADLRPDLDVYAHLRILPAVYFIDRFDKKRLDEIEKHHSASRSGAPNFEDVCLAQMEQLHSKGLVREMSFGYCATKLVCDKLCKFINDNYPENLAVGPVRSAGDDNVINPKVGIRNVAPSLQVPKTLAIK